LSLLRSSPPKHPSAPAPALRPPVNVAHARLPPSPADAPPPGVPTADVAPTAEAADPAAVVRARTLRHPAAIASAPFDAATATWASSGAEPPDDDGPAAVAPFAPPPLKRGDTVKHYEVVRLLGRGGMGAVYLARDTKLGRLVALKVLTGHDAHSARRLLNEARATARCTHENIVVLYEADEADGRPYLALEYLEGPTLRDWLGQCGRGESSASGSPAPGGGEGGGGESVTAALAIELMKPVVRALSCAHAHGIVHRDLKPANIVLTEAGPIKVLDFGIAKHLGDAAAASAAFAASGGEVVAGAAELTQQGAAVGTLQYMAPEQWRGEAVDARADLWAVGVMLFRLATGEHPIRPCTMANLSQVARPELPMPSALALRPDLPPAFAAVIARCLAKDQAARFGTADELLAALEALGGSPGRLAGEAEASPFAGLAPLGEDDAGRFFGRDREVAAALGRLRALPLLAVAGPSGAGKSSFVRAGLMPAWKRAHESAEAFVLRPGRRPLGALAELLAQGRGAEGGDPAGDRAPPAERLAAEPGLFGARLRARCRAARQGHRLLVFVDQFEELYTLGAPAEERAAFLACLLGAGDDPSSPVRVVLSVRSDFLDRTADDGPFAAELGRGLLLLPPVGPAGLREALVRPLEATGYRFEDEALLGAVAGELGAARTPLPLLQFTGALLWAERDRGRRVLTRASYERLGGVAGALSAHADATLATMAPEERSLCRAVLLRLVTAERTRAVAGLGELAALGGDGAGRVERVVRRLADARLVSLGPVVEGDVPAESTVELVHEALIERWPTLGRWLDESAHDVQFVQRLREAARQWRAGGEAEGLLWRDRSADEARAWWARRRGERVPGVGEREERFVRALLALAGRSRRRRRALAGGAFAAVSAAALVVSTLAWRAEREAGRANREAARTRAEAERADREALASRNVTRLAVARELMATDPTAAFGLLREVEPTDLPREWDELARQALTAGVSTAVYDLPERPYVAAFDPSGGGRVATSEVGNAVRVWSLDGAGEPAVLRGHEGALNGVKFSPDGRRLATSSVDRTARVWHAGGAGAPVVLRHRHAVFGLDFSPDGERLVTSTSGGEVLVWRADGAGEPLVLRGHAGGANSAAFSPDGRRIVTASDDKTVRIWSADGRGAPRTLRGHQGAVGGAAFSPDGRRVVSHSSDHTVRVWDLEGDAPTVVYELGASALATAISPDGRYVVSSSFEGAVGVWGAGGSGQLLSLRGHSEPPAYFAFSRDGRRLFSASVDKTMRVWALEEALRLLTLSGHDAVVNEARFDPDGRRVATASDDGTVRVWDADGAGRPVVLRGPLRVTSVSFAPDGERVVGASVDGSLRIWNADGPGRPLVLPGLGHGGRHSEAVISVAFSPDGSRLVTASRDGIVRVRPADGRGEPLALRGHGDVANAASFSPDGARIVSASDDKTVRIWSADGAGEPLVLRGHDGAVSSASFGPDGARVVSASEDKTVRVWPADGRGEPLVLRGHEKGVSHAAFSPDGARIVSASYDQTVRVWPADGRGEPLVLRGHQAPVMQAQFSPEGGRIVSASFEHVVRVWSGLGPLGGPDAPAVWAASTYCVPAERRVALLHASEADARAQAEACARRVRTSSAPAPRRDAGR
jgi:WD40 repeat protein/serine/threonine protein kinase